MPQPAEQFDPWRLAAKVIAWVAITLAGILLAGTGFFFKGWSDMRVDVSDIKANVERFHSGGE